MVPVDTITAIYKMLEDSSTILREIPESAEAEIYVALSSDLSAIMKKWKGLLEPIMSRNVIRDVDESPKLSFDLEDTVDALKNIRSADVEPKPIRDEEPPKVISSLMSNKHYKHKLNGHSSRGFKSNFKKNSRCAACGMKGHWARDLECPAYNTYPKGGQGSKRKGNKWNEPHPKKSVRFQIQEESDSDSSDSDAPDTKRFFK